MFLVKILQRPDR